MPFPLASLTPPTLSKWQMSYRGVAFGGIVQGATYQLQGFPEGLDTPDYISGDAQRALDQGEFEGVDLSPGRNVTIKQVIQAASDEALDHARQTLGSALGPATAAQPLYLCLASGTFACMAKPRKHKAPAELLTAFAKANEANTLFHATDPRWYAMPTKTATVALPAPPGGVTFPLTFNVSFGGGSFGALVTVENNGNFEMRPRLIVTGPCTTPTITNLSIPGAPSLSFNISLASGDTLAIDTDFQTVVYTPVGTSGGASRRGTLVFGSTWFNLPPGMNALEFTSADTTQVTGTLTVESADAYIAL
ncbi:MAG TPA: hypothetical protein VGN13_12415 [Solirubrobacteraceae bacterium]|jgi:hypothetical protein